jgi:YQGE family putative transporter
VEREKKGTLVRLSGQLGGSRLCDAETGEVAEGHAKVTANRGLRGQARLLLAAQGLYGTANALSGTFVPVYLWKAAGSFALIGWFSFFQALVSGLTFWLAGTWVKTHNKMNSLRSGLFLSCVFYSAVLWLGKDAKHYVAYLGGLSGMAGGFFWLAYNVVYFEITEPDTRDRFNGWAGFFGSLAGIIAPWMSGLIITSLRGEQGYRVIFAISLAVFGCAGVVSFFLKKRKSGGSYGWLYGFKQLAQKGNPWRAAVPALAAQGVREGVYMFLLGLLVFIATSQERSLGNFSFWTSLVSLISFWLIGRQLNVRRRKMAMLVGAVMITLVILPIFWKVSYSTLLWLGIGTALFMPLYAVPMTSTTFDLIGATEESARRREELIVLRELGLIVGRLIGLSAYLAVVSVTDSSSALVWLLFGVGAMPIAGWFVLRRRLGKHGTAGGETAG